MKGLDQDHRKKISYIRYDEGSRDSEALKFRFFESLKRRRNLKSEKKFETCETLKNRKFEDMEATVPRVKHRN